MPNAKSLKLLADVMNAATWEWHIPSGEIFVNQRWSQMLGYRPEELAPFSIETWKSLTHPDDLEKAMLTLDKVLNKGEEFYSAELRIRHKDGHWHYILDSGKVIERDENGKAIRALGTHIDIHERKMLEQEYRRTQQMLNEVVHHTRDIIYRTDGRGKLLYLSDAVTQYLGYSQEQAVGALLQDFVHPNDRDQFIAYFDKVSRKHVKQEYITFRIRHINGTWRTYETIASPLFEQEVFNGYVGVARDITRIKQINYELEEQRQEMERFFRVNTDLFCIIDHQGKFTKVNAAWEKVLGYPTEYLVGRNFLHFIHPEDVKNTEEVARLIIEEKQETDRFINRYRRIDGTYVDIEWSAIPHLNSLYASGRDISKRVEIQRQLQEEKDHFKATLMSVGDGIIVVSTDETISDMNEAAVRILTYRLEDVIGHHIDDICRVYDENQRIIGAVSRVLKTKNRLDFKAIRVLDENDKFVLLDATITPITNAQQQTSGAVITFRDVGSLVERQRQIEYLSYHDQLTGLYNRHYLDQMIHEIDIEANLPLAIISLDLNNLKYINDHFGHFIGDKALIKTAEAIKKMGSERGVGIRMGGDEFLLLITKTDQTKARKVVEDIVAYIEAITLKKHHLQVAVGLHVLERPTKDIYAAIKCADDDMYAHKQKKKQQV